MWGLILLFATAAVAHSKSIAFKACDQPSAAVSDVTLEPCDQEPCVLIRGQNASIGILFKTGAAGANQVTNKVYGRIGTVRVPFPIDYPNACDGTQGLTCPLTPDTEYHFHYTLLVSLTYPAIGVVVLWKMFDEQSTELVCVRFHVQLH